MITWKSRGRGRALLSPGPGRFLDAGHTHVSQLRTGTGDIAIGLSTHAPDQAQRAAMPARTTWPSARVYPTGTKPTAKPVTLEYVRWAAANVLVPWFAIGGVNLQTVDEVVAAGARRICVVSAILNAADVAAECRQYRQRLPTLNYTG